MEVMAEGRAEGRTRKTGGCEFHARRKNEKQEGIYNVRWWEGELRRYSCCLNDNVKSNIKGKVNDKCCFTDMILHP